MKGATPAQAISVHASGAGFIMLKRTITSIVGVAILIPVLIFSDTVLLPSVIAFAVVIAMYEMFRCLGTHKQLALTIPFYIFGAASPFAVRYLDGGLDYRAAALIMIALLLLYSLTVIVISRGKVRFSDASAVFTAAVYISFSFSGIVFLRDFENDYIYLLVFIGAWVTDIFAYLVGMAIGKHKLLPEISPKKTIEGSIGGIVFCTAAFVLTAYIIDIMYIGLPVIICAGIIVSCVSQIGDLAMSAIKRQHGIKDYGKLFPGHGGVLDRFDSILAVSAVMTVLLAVLNIIQK